MGGCERGAINCGNVVICDADTAVTDTGWYVAATLVS